MHSQVTDPGQRQVQTAFAHKWGRTPDWGIHGETASVMTDWMMPLLGWRDEAEYAGFLSGKSRVLDAGCGNGREAIRMARLNPGAEVVGIDLSDIEAAQNNARGLDNISFVKADLTEAPFPPASFDYILSFGVLHHTPDTRRSLESLLPLLSPGGELAFYVYRQKPPLREYSDDLVRDALQEMAPDEAWQEMESLTRFGKALADLNVEIDVPEVSTLGIREGRHNVQRLVYYAFLKCYWRDGWSMEENTHVNFDWFYPRYAWRHTPEEVRGWLAENDLDETYYGEIDAGLWFRVKLTRRSGQGLTPARDPDPVDVWWPYVWSDRNLQPRGRGRGPAGTANDDRRARPPRA